MNLLSILWESGKKNGVNVFLHAPPRPLYSTSLKNDKMDVTDLVDLIRQAYTALDSWFSLIGQQDVDEAIQEIQLSG